MSYMYAESRSERMEERPPQVSSQGAAATSAPKRWIPPSITRRDARHPEEQNDAIFRKVRGILNKLTPEKFDKLSLELLNVGIANQVILKGIILLIFEKALDEPKYSTIYAQLCHRLCQDAPNFEPPSSNISTFRRLLLNKCQDEFENRSKATEAFDGRNILTPDEEEQLQLAKHKMLGNIKFIGELGKLEMLHEGILHKCIKQLLEKKKHVPIADMAEDLECLCQIMKTVGRRLDKDKARSWMDAYFDRIKKYQLNSELPSRIRFMLQDVVELRDNNWKPRKIMQDNGPKTIGEVREEAAKDFGMILPNQTRLSSMNMFGPMMMNGNMMGFPSTGTRGGLNDMFGGPLGMLGLSKAKFLKGNGFDYTGGGDIGTGPGVIPMDGFTPGYSANMGRAGRNMNMMMHPNQMFQKPYENRHRQQRQDSDDGSPKMEQRNNRPNNKQHHNQQNQQQQRGDGGESGGRGGGGGGGGQYYTNNRNNNQQQNRDMGTSRELPPRFMKKLQQQQPPNETHAPMYNGRGSGGRDQSDKPMGGGPPIGAVQTNGPSSMPPGAMTGTGAGGMRGTDGEISLRPARNFTVLKPNTPSMLPKSAQINVHSHTPPMTRPGQNPEDLNPLKQKQAQITIKQAPAPDKTNKQKQKNHSKEELQEAREKMLKTYFEEADAEAAANVIKELKPPKKYLNELVAYVMLESLDKGDNDRDNISKLISAMKKEGVITGEHFMEGLTSVMDKMSNLSVDVPLVKSYVAKMAAQGVSNQLVTLLELSEPMNGGAYYPLFLLVLQQLHKLHDSDWVTSAFQESKINLQDMLPESDRSKERMMEILEDRGLSFMFPLLRVQSDLWKQIRNDPSPNNIYKWIKENVKEDLQKNPRFIIILISNILRHVTNESTLAKGTDPGVLPDKSLQNKEKDLLSQYQPMLQKLLHEKANLQLVAIYAMQVHCNNNSFPKGMLLRLFMYMYDLEVIEEEAYLRWKEEVNDEYPGKGNSLFQVNSWLTWLEQAEEESDEDDEE